MVISRLIVLRDFRSNHATSCATVLMLAYSRRRCEKKGPTCGTASTSSPPRMRLSQSRSVKRLHIFLVPKKKALSRDTSNDNRR